MELRFRGGILSKSLALVIAFAMLFSVLPGFAMPTYEEPYVDETEIVDDEVYFDLDDETDINEENEVNIDDEIVEEDNIFGENDEIEPELPDLPDMDWSDFDGFPEFPDEWDFENYFENYNDEHDVWTGGYTRRYDPVTSTLYITFLEEGEESVGISPAYIGIMPLNFARPANMRVHMPPGVPVGVGEASGVRVWGSGVHSHTGASIPGNLMNFSPSNPWGGGNAYTTVTNNTSGPMTWPFTVLGERIHWVNQQQPAFRWTWTAPGRPGVSGATTSMNVVFYRHATPQNPTMSTRTQSAINLNTIASHVGWTAEFRRRPQNGVWGAWGTTANFGGLAANSTHGFQMRWSDGVASSTTSAEVLFTTLPNAPTAPTLSARAENGTEMTLNHVTNVVNWERVYRRRPNNGAAGTETAWQTGLVFTAGLTPNTQHQFQAGLRPTGTSVAPAVVSGWSQYFRTVPATPLVPGAATSITPRSITLPAEGNGNTPSESPSQFQWQYQWRVYTGQGAEVGWAAVPANRTIAGRSPEETIQVRRRFQRTTAFNAVNFDSGWSALLTEETLALIELEAPPAPTFEGLNRGTYTLTLNEIAAVPATISRVQYAIYSVNGNVVPAVDRVWQDSRDFVIDPENTYQFVARRYMASGQDADNFAEVGGVRWPVGPPSDIFEWPPSRVYRIIDVPANNPQDATNRVWDAAPGYEHTVGDAWPTGGNWAHVAGLSPFAHALADARPGFALSRVSPNSAYGWLGPVSGVAPLAPYSVRAVGYIFSGFPAGYFIDTFLAVGVPAGTFGFERFVFGMPETHFTVRRLPPPPTTGARLVERTTNSITLGVDAAINTDLWIPYFRIYEGNGDWSDWQRSATFSGLTAGEMYDFQVRYYPAGGESGTVTITAPFGPVSFRAVPNAPGQAAAATGRTTTSITFPAEGHDGTDVVAPPSQFVWEYEYRIVASGQGADDGWVAMTSREVGSLTAGQTVEVRRRLVRDAVGNSGAWNVNYDSAWSAGPHRSESALNTGTILYNLNGGEVGTGPLPNPATHTPGTVTINTADVPLHDDVNGVAVIFIRWVSAQYGILDINGTLPTASFITDNEVTVTAGAQTEVWALWGYAADGTTPDVLTFGYIAYDLGTGDVTTGPIPNPARTLVGTGRALNTTDIPL
ncbi:MAG: hypothetical protein FWE04_01990, partial [Oscillospiraceae bacterium]|nr:hypothetical protein [Oscillospiraceae bacterium]